MNKYLDKEFVKNIKPKLVRDNIPSIIVSENKRCTFRKLKNNEIEEARKNKIIEEMGELKEALFTQENQELKNINSLNELADLIEIISFYLYNKAPTKQDFMKDLIEVMVNKRISNGSFENNYILEKVEFVDD